MPWHPSHVELHKKFSHILDSYICYYLLKGIYPFELVIKIIAQTLLEPINWPFRFLWVGFWPILVG